MQEFIAKNSRQLYWYCKELLVLEYDYTIEHFEIEPNRVAFRLKVDATEEQAEKLQKMFNAFYR